MASGVKFNVKSSGGKELRGAVGAVAKAARAAAERAVADEARAVADDERRNVPVVTGELQRSISQRASGLGAEVAPTARHAPFVEFGSFKDPAQPFVGPAAQRSRRRFPGRFADAVKRAVEKLTQVAADPADALQVGIYALLSADEDLGAGVFDNVPEEEALPYVVIGEMISVEDSAHGSTGRETSATLHTWTRARSHRPGNQIGARLAALLTRRQAELGQVVEGHLVWRVEHEFAQTLVDPEPGIRHRVDRFRIWTRQEE